MVANKNILSLGITATPQVVRPGQRVRLRLYPGNIPQHSSKPQFFFCSDAGIVRKSWWSKRRGWIDTTDLKPGTYTVKGFADYGFMKYQNATAVATFTVSKPWPAYFDAISERPFIHALRNRASHARINAC